MLFLVLRPNKQRAELEEKSTTLPQLVRDVMSQGKPVPPKLLTNLQIQTIRAQRAETSAGSRAGKPEQKTPSGWGLSVEKAGTKPPATNHAEGTQGTNAGAGFTSRSAARFSGKMRGKSPPASSRGRGKVPV